MEGKTYTFYAPCSMLDIEAMQTWLEDMSLEGYLLKSCARARQKFEFYKIEPLRTRYRLTPVSNRIEEWNLRPGEEYASITEAYGWEHVCSSTRLHIFRAYDEDACEIHTDPIIQAQAIRQLGWRIIKTALIWLSMPLIYLLILFAFGGANHFWQTVILDRTGIQIPLAYCMLMAAVIAMVELVQLGILYKQVKRGYAPVNRKEWKKKAPVYRAAYRALPVILFVLALVVVMGRAAYRENAAYKDLPAPGTELPFLSVADMALSSEVQSAERLDAGYMRSWSHLLCPVNYDWAEIVEIVDSSGAEGLVSIQLLYHEASDTWLAENLTQEYLAAAKQAGTEMAEKPQTGADLAYFYYNEYGAPAAVLRYGNTVVSVEFPRSDIDVPTLKFEYWIETLDHALKSS